MSLVSAERPVLEVIALDAEDAVAAREGGADRLELVCDMAADGLSPSAAVFAAVREAVDLPVRVMLRLSDGFSAGGDAGVGALVRRAEELREAGATEFVLGFLDGSGLLDLAATERVVTALDGCAWTFHRALDHAADRAAVRKALAGLPGLDLCLTAGAAGGVGAGLPVLLAEAAAATPGDPGLMVGGGLRLEHLPPLLAGGVGAFHVGGAVRGAGGWAGSVSPAAVRAWRTAVDLVPAA
ncbi:copper homeostasis protein CutC [Streptomyces fragilis]|uniref:Copper homeostasis protein cutC homolog n=1 Tax=Streptomyces fragilis TaxID=67301 RepID=A0ABV2YCY7_9ACTN|nr:copper homeostasis protein CutC [Streptomyces fragilis]